MQKLVECVPNFSCGRDPLVMAEIVSVLKDVEGATLLDYEMDKDHNRAVVTFIGTPEAAQEGAIRMVEKARDLIDLNHHKGEHPRMGACDVCPFVPLEGITMAECVNLARETAEKITERTGVPTYCYDKAAFTPERIKLPDVRKGEFEGLREAVKTQKDRRPDFGGPDLHPTAGATAVSARAFLVAFNVNLTTDDVNIADKIAKAVRGKSGGYASVRGLGFYLEEKGCAQISMNLVNYKRSPIFRVFETIKSEAARYGVGIWESEVIGLLPNDALIDCADYYLQLFPEFDKNQIIENRLLAMGGEPSTSVEPFLNKVASDEPAPGGGSVSALAGALGASLASMFGKLTAGKKKFKDVKEQMIDAVGRAEKLKDTLHELIERDANAFDAIMKAMKMNKGTDEEKQARLDALQEATKGAISVPLETMARCLEVVEICSEVVEKGNPNAISDCGVAAMIAVTGCKGAFYNVLINLGGLDDKKFADKSRKEGQAILDKAVKLGAKVEKSVMKAIS